MEVEQPLRRKQTVETEQGHQNISINLNNWVFHYIRIRSENSARLRWDTLFVSIRLQILVLELIFEQNNKIFTKTSTEVMQTANIYPEASEIN